MLGTNSPMSAGPHLRKVPYDAVRDFTPISLVGNYTFFVVVHPSVPARTLQELIAYAKANPGKLNYATGNTSGIVMTGMLASQAGMDLVHVPYKSEPPAITDLLSGNVQLMLSSYSTVAAFLREGRLRPLVTTLPNRSPLMPEAPTMAEAGQKGISIQPFAAIYGPAKMPRDIVERIASEVQIAMAKQDVKDGVARYAFEAQSSTPAQLADFHREQLEIWKKTVSEVGIVPD
jgi:tripartite-type tricarboxylate transporter receptor subunit TctC